MTNRCERVKYIFRGYEVRCAVCLLPLRGVPCAARLSFVATCVRSNALAADDRSKFLCYKIFHNLTEMLVIYYQV